MSTFEPLIDQETAESLKADMKAMGDAYVRAFNEAGDALRRFVNSIGSWDARALWVAYRYGDCQAHYRTRRVTARQYRAWKRQGGPA